MTSHSGTAEPFSVDAIIRATGLAGLRPDAPAPAQEAALKALETATAGLDPIRRGLVRHAAIHALKGAGVDGAAGLVDAAMRRPADDAQSTGSGTPAVFPDLAPWPMVVAGATVLAELEAAIVRHVVLAVDAAVAMALWILHTHAIEAAQITPRLAILSPTKRCGKSTVLKILGALVRRPLASTNISAAALYRGVEAHQPTLLVDEADTFLETHPDLRGVLNGGHDRLEKLRAADQVVMLAGLRPTTIETAIPSGGSSGGPNLCETTRPPSRVR